MINVRDYKASGSVNVFTGSISQGGSILSLPVMHDYQEGMGVLVPGAGPVVPNSRETLSVVIDGDAQAAGTVTLSLPGAATKTYTAAASVEQFEFTITGVPTFSSFVELVIDNKAYYVYVEPTQTVEQVAAAIRAYKIDGWYADPAATGALVRFICRSVGKHSKTEVNPNGTGIPKPTLTVTAGTQTTALELAAWIAGQAYTGWSKNRYANSNVVSFVATSDGYKQGDTATIDFGGSGMTGRVTVTQFGQALIAKVLTMSGGALTLDKTATAGMTGVKVYHEDTAAIQAAIDAATGGKGKVYAPAGKYRIGQLNIGSDMDLEGDGRLCTIFEVHGYAQHGLYIGNGKQNIGIRNLQVLGASAPASMEPGKDVEAAGIKIRYALNVDVENCLVDGSDDAGIGVTCEDAQNVNGDTDMSRPRFLPARHIRVKNNLVRNIAEGCGIEVSCAEDVDVFGNQVTRCAETGIRQVGCRRVTTTHNRVSRVPVGIKGQGYGGDSGTSRRTEDCTIAYNTITNLSVGTGRGIVMYAYVTGYTVERNTIIADYIGGLAGVSLEGSTPQTLSNPNTNEDISVYRNFVRGMDRGISATHSQRNIRIKHNDLVGQQANNANGSTNSYGVYLSNSSNGDFILQDVTVEDNDITSYTPNMYGIREINPQAAATIRVKKNRIRYRNSNPDHAQNRAIGPVPSATGGGWLTPITGIKYFEDFGNGVKYDDNTYIQFPM